MLNFFTRSLLRTITGVFFLVAVVPLGTAGYLAFTYAKEGLEKAAFDKLRSERELRRKELIRSLHLAMDNLSFLAATPTVRKGVEQLTSYHENKKGSPDSTFDVGSDLYQRIYSEISPLFRSFPDTHKSELNGYDDFLLISAKTGHVMFSLGKLEDLGDNLNTGKLSQSGLAKVWQKVVSTEKPALADYSRYEPTKGVSAFLGVPVKGADGKVSAVLVLRLGSEAVNAVFISSWELGKTAEVYVVGQDLIMRSQSRFVNDPTVLVKKVDTLPAREAVQDMEGAVVIENDQGQSLLSSYSHVGLNEDERLGADFDWGVLAEQGRSEAFQSVTGLSIRMALIGLVAAAAAIVCAFLLAKRLSGPIIRAAGVAAKVSEGDLTVELPEVKRNDEIGALVRAIRLMITDLREQIRRIADGARILSSAATEISLTVSQLAAGSTETTTAVTETTTTVEQVRQSAKVSADKARNVTETSEKAAEASESGKVATDEAEVTMKRIKEQMQSIGESVMRLNEKSETIQSIISAVQDLADQSNLLAVNASIEAVRAGDLGKGFGVVAAEIKSLADQSKTATGRIREILADIRNSITATVLTAEQSAGSVQSGVEKSRQAGESIKLLADSVGAAVKAARVIEASSAQQNVGVDQVARAMSSIQDAMRQNSEGVAQLEQAARSLSDFAKDLNGLVDRYRI